MTKPMVDDTDDDSDFELSDDEGIILALDDDPDHDRVNGGSIRGTVLERTGCDARRTISGITWVNLTLTYAQGVKLADWLNSVALPRLREHEGRQPKQQGAVARA